MSKNARLFPFVSNVGVTGQLSNRFYDTTEPSGKLVIFIRMKTSNVLALLLLISGFTSCDPGYRLLVNNHSGKDVKIRVAYNHSDTYWRRYFLDSSQEWRMRQYDGLTHPVYNSRVYITFYDSSDKFSVKEVKRAVIRLSIFDSACNCISFILPAKESVVLEVGFGTAPHSQKIIFNDNDSVDVPFSKRVRKKPKLWPGGNYMLSSAN